MVANLRVDQAWGFAGISASLHDASGAYYNTAPVVNACAVTGNCVNNGHPEDKYGWALAGGAKFNLPGGDMIGFNVCYSEGAAGYCTNQGAFQLYQNSDRLGIGWIADGVFASGTQIELTKVWSALAAYEHLAPEMAYRGRWRLRQSRLQQAATNLIKAHPLVKRTAASVAAAGG